MEFSHLDRQGRPRMVDVGAKQSTRREAVAEAVVIMDSATRDRLLNLDLPKGDALTVARLAGIAAAKETSRLIPLCHPLSLDLVEVDCQPQASDRIVIQVRAKATGRTGVEMEAMTGAAVAALAIYDMIKGVDRGAFIEKVVLLAKQGGQSGEYRRKEAGSVRSHATPRLRSINRAARKGLPKAAVEEGMLLEGKGLDGDAHAGPGDRQVSLLAMESIEKMQGKGLSLRPGDFAENLTVEGLELHTLPVGTRLRVGQEGVLLEVSRIGKLCHTGCAIRDQVGDCIMPREGIFARVVRGGKVRPGDEVEVEKTAEGGAG